MAVADPDWQTKRSTVALRMKYIFNNELMSDVKFVVPVSNESEVKKVIPAHKFLLAVGSPVFFTMFYGQMAENIGDSVELTDCDYESLLELFRFLYSDEVKLKKANVVAVMYLAKKYMVPAVVKLCGNYLHVHMLGENSVFAVLPIAHTFEEENLEKACWKVIDKRTEQALKSDDFCAVQRSVVESVVKREMLRVTEADLFKAVDRWATRQCKKSGKSKREIVGDEIVKALRFPLMSQKEFLSVAADRGILTTREVVDMMKHYNDMVLTSPLPYPQIPRVYIWYDICRRFKGYVPPIQSPEEQDSVNYHLDFKVDRAIHLHGIQHFGSENATYTVSVEVHNLFNQLVAEQTGTYVSKKDDVHDYYGFVVMFDYPIRINSGVYYPIDSKITGPSPWAGIKEDPSFKFSELIFDCSVRDGKSAGQYPGFLFDQDIEAVYGIDKPRRAAFKPSTMN